MAAESFDVTYDGPALKSGRMPVRELAPALLALANLFALAGGELQPELEPVSVEVEATTEGSFVVKLFLDAHESWEQFVDFWSSPDATALVNLKEAVLGTLGLFGLAKFIGRRRVTKADRTLDPGKVRLILDDQTSIEVPTDTWTLYRSVEVRKQAREVVSPLRREGVTSVVFRATTDADTAEAVEIDQTDLDAFAEIEGAVEPLLEHTQEMFLEVVAPSFKRGNKWRVTIGDAAPFYASVLDEDFLDRVESGEEAFRSGDLIRCLVVQTQTRDVEGLHTDWRILEVLEHKPRGIQLKIEGTAGDDAADAA